MLACGAPATASFVAIAYEVITAWPVLIAVGVWVFLGDAPEWWESAGPQLSASLHRAWPWALAIAVASTRPGSAPGAWPTRCPGNSSDR